MTVPFGEPHKRAELSKKRAAIIAKDEAAVTEFVATVAQALSELDAPAVADHIAATECAALFAALGETPPLEAHRADLGGAHIYLRASLNAAASNSVWSAIQRGSDGNNFFEPSPDFVERARAALEAAKN